MEAEARSKQAFERNKQRRQGGSTGVVEQAVQGTEGHIRVVLLALESRMRRQVGPEEVIVSFMTEYAAY